MRFLRSMNQTPNIMAARTPIPPTTPPTIAPIGVDFFFELVFEGMFAPSSWPIPGSALPMDADLTLEAEEKDTETGLRLDFTVTAPLKHVVSEAVFQS